MITVVNPNREAGMNPKLIEAVRASFPASGEQIVLGAVVEGTESHP